MSEPFVAVAGAAGALGRLIVAELTKRNMPVKALVRPGTAPARTESLRQLSGVTVVEAELTDHAKLTEELKGARSVVSSVQGLADVMLTAQGGLLDAAVAAKVPRFIPSDFALDFTKTQPGTNRNLDLRRQFHAQLDKSGVAWTSVLNGGFMELLTAEGMAMVDRKKRKVIYVESADQKVDFTTMRDTAAFTAAVAADTHPTPKYLRIAGDTLSIRELAAAATQADPEGSTKPFSVSYMGSIWLIKQITSTMRFFGGEDQVMPMWQGMQYMINMFSGDGKMDVLDNDRYPEIRWTTAKSFLQESFRSKD